MSHERKDNDDYFIVGFDFETGGFDFSNGILSACFFHPPAFPDDPSAFEEYSLIQPPPGTVISPKALEVNKIDVKELAGKPTFDEFMIQQVFPRLPRGRRILFVGHNAFDFDSRWLRHYMEQVYPNMLHAVPDYNTMWFFSDTLDMIKSYKCTLEKEHQPPSNKLADVYPYFFDGETFDAHCALDDTRACGRLFLCLKEKMGDKYPVKCWSSVGCMMIITEENVDRLLYS